MSKRKTDADLLALMMSGGKHRLQVIHKAAYAIEAINRLLTENADSHDDDEPALFGGYVKGGLDSGVQVLAGLIQDNTSELLDWIGADPFGQKEV